MKKLLPLLSLTLLFGCATGRYANYTEIASLTDLRPYTEAGFFISPGMEGVRYNPIGTISMSFAPGIKNTETKVERAVYEDIQKTMTSQTSYTTVKAEELFQPNEAYMLDKVVEYAKSMGANGLLNYRISYDYINIPSSLSKSLGRPKDFDNLADFIKAHPDQRYGEVTITAFAVEIIK